MVGKADARGLSAARRKRRRRAPTSWVRERCEMPARGLPEARGNHDRSWNPPAIGV